MPEAFNGVDVAAIVNQAASTLMGQLQQSGKELQDAQSAFKSATTPQASLIESAGAAESDLKVQDETNKERIRQMNAEAASMFGTNQAANSFILAGLGQEITSSIQDLAGMRKDIQDRKSLGIFDDPLQFIVNQVVTPFKEEAAEYREETIRQDLATAQGLIARTHESFAINAAIADTEAETRINAIKKAMLAKTGLEVLQSNERIAKTGVEFINVRNANNKAQFEAVSNAINIQVRLEDLKLSERNADRADQYFGLAMRGDIRAEDAADRAKTTETLHNDMQRLQIEAAGGNAEAKVTLRDSLKRAAAVVGAEAPTLEQFKLMDARQKASWQRLMSDPNVMLEGRLGYNTGMAMEEVAENNWPLTGNTRAVYNNLDRIRAETISKYSSGTTPLSWQSMGKDARANAINQAIREQLNKEIKNIPDSGSIFSAPPVAATLRIPAVADTSIAKDLIPQAANPNNPLRAQDVLSSALMKMSKGEASPQQMASEISTIYRAVIADNNVQRQYSRFALGGMSELSTGFKASVKLGNYYQGAPTFASSSTVVDMSNEAQLTAVLTREAARMSVQKQGSTLSMPDLSGVGTAIMDASDRMKGGRFDPSLNNK